MLVQGDGEEHRSDSPGAPAAADGSRPAANHAGGLQDLCRPLQVPAARAGAEQRRRRGLRGHGPGCESHRGGLEAEIVPVRLEGDLKVLLRDVQNKGIPEYHELVELKERNKAASKVTVVC